MIEEIIRQYQPIIEHYERSRDILVFLGISAGVSVAVALSDVIKSDVIKELFSRIYNKYYRSRNLK